MNTTTKLIGAEAFEVFNTGHDMLMLELDKFWPMHTDGVDLIVDRIENLGKQLIELSANKEANRAQLDEVLNEIAIRSYVAVVAMRMNERFS